MTDRPKNGKIIVFGIMFFYPLAGVTYQFLHYLLGLRRMGYDVYYVEDSDRYIYDPSINDMTDDVQRNLTHISAVLRDYGFDGRWALRTHFYGNRECYGMTEAELLQLYREADAFLNVTASQELRDEHMDVPNRILVESDPFSSQVTALNGDEKCIDLLSRHNWHFTFGENIGRADCLTPHEQFNWNPTRQAVDLPLWSGNATCGGDKFTTIMTWANKNKDVTYRGETYYWTKNISFERIMELPRRCDTIMELAVSPPEDVEERLRDHGWRLTPSIPVSNDVGTYRDYIQNSRGEFTVARDQYIRPRTGWFSDRSACYLAAGRPVITEDTAFDCALPVGEGLFAFETMDDILAAIDAINTNYEKHCAAARQIADEYFCAQKVIGNILINVGMA